MFKKLFVAYLKSFDRWPFLRALGSTLTSVSFAIVPVVLVVVWRLLSDWLKSVFGYPWTFSFFDWAWLNELITRFMRWIAESAEMLLPSIMVLIFGAFFLWAYARRNWFFVFLAARVFKKVTTPFFIFYFSAFLLKFLIGFEYFCSLDSLIKDWGLENVVESGKWVFIITGIIWFLMSYASYKQVEIVKRERLKNKQPPTFLDRLDRMRKAYIKKNT